jgi:acetylglutamate kinase
VVSLRQKEIVVVKLGGSVLDKLHATFFAQCVELERQNISLVVIHGGGPMISKWMKMIGKVPQFVDGRRVTDTETLSLVEMVLAGSVNKQLVSQLTSAGVAALGLSGVDLQLLRVQPKDPDLGFVGEVNAVNGKNILRILEQGWVPVIASLGANMDGQHFNVNADEAAAAIAHAIGAKQLIVVSDVDGIHIGNKENATVLTSVTSEQIEHLISTHIISGGMIPKVRAAVKCLQGSVKEVRIVNGAKPFPLDIYPTQKQIGTRIVKKEVVSVDSFSHVSTP